MAIVVLLGWSFSCKMWEKGFETLALKSEEYTEMDKPMKRYDKLGQQIDKFLKKLSKR